MSEMAVAGAEGSVQRAFAVLERLAIEGEPMRLSAIAIALGMQKSTVHRILSTLVDLGYVEQNSETACYRATLRLWELGAGLLQVHPVKRIATVYLQQLQKATGETVSLTVLSGDDVLYLDKLLAARPIRFTSRVGSRAPAPLTAGGKAMLAYEPGAREIIKRAQTRIAEKRRIATSTILKELEGVRSSGFAVSSFSPGVESFGAPVMGRDGRAAAAISVSAPISRLSEDRREVIIEHLLSTCADLADQVGAI